MKIDSTGQNALVTSENGLKVDISNKIDKIASATGTKIALTTASGGVSESTYTIKSDGDMGAENNLIRDFERENNILLDAEKQVKREEREKDLEMEM